MGDGYIGLRRFAATANRLGVTFHINDANRPGDAEEFQQAYVDVGKIQLIPGQAVAGGCRVGVVVVVPAFAEGEQGDPPVVARIVACGEAAASPHVGCGIH